MNESGRNWNELATYIFGEPVLGGSGAGGLKWDPDSGGTELEMWEKELFVLQ